MPSEVNAAKSRARRPLPTTSPAAAAPAQRTVLVTMAMPPKPTKTPHHLAMRFIITPGSGS